MTKIIKLNTITSAIRVSKSPPFFYLIQKVYLQIMLVKILLNNICVSILVSLIGNVVNTVDS